MTPPHHRGRAAARRAVPRHGALALALTLACTLVTPPAQAAPDADRAAAVLQLLEDKGPAPRAEGGGPSAEGSEPRAEGLVPKADALQPSPLVQRMREAASDLVLSAMGFLGVRYRRGGNSADEGFDCSGFTRYVFEHSLGLVLPRRADQQATRAGLLEVRHDELRPGDLVFFNTMRRAFSHVGIYVGEGKFIHAPRSGAQVRIEDMREAYWTRRYDGARRVDGAAPGVLAALPLAAAAAARPAATAPSATTVEPQSNARAPAAPSTPTDASRSTH